MTPLNWLNNSSEPIMTYVLLKMLFGMAQDRVKSSKMQIQSFEHYGKCLVFK